MCFSDLDPDPHHCLEECGAEMYCVHPRLISSPAQVTPEMESSRLQTINWAVFTQFVLTLIIYAFKNSQVHMKI